MRRRVRWGNVGRLAAGIAVLALVVMWPRIAGQAPAVPDGTAVPVVEGPAAGPAPADAARPRPRSRRRDETNGDRPGKRRRPRALSAPRREPAETAPPAAVEPTEAPPPAEPPVAPPPAAVDPPMAPPPAAVQLPEAPPPAPTVDPAELEFGFER